MAVETVQTQYCRTCGAEIRAGSAFCYNCGKELFPSDAGSNGVAESRSMHVSDLPQIPAPSEPLATATTSSNGELVRNRGSRRAKRPQPQVVEVTWAKPDGSSPAFYVITGVLVSLAFLLIVLALYLR